MLASSVPGGMAVEPSVGSSFMVAGDTEQGLRCRCRTRINEQTAAMLTGALSEPLEIC